jgi:hypothetical protein
MMRQAFGVHVGKGACKLTSQQDNLGDIKLHASLTMFD